VEQFFLEALEQVREEVLKEKIRAATTKTISDGGEFYFSLQTTDGGGRAKQFCCNSNFRVRTRDAINDTATSWPCHFVGV